MSRLDTVPLLQRTALGRVTQNVEYTVTKRQMLERLIARADDAIVRRLNPDSEQWDLYFNVPR